MDDVQKQILKGELQGIKGMISASAAAAAGLNQTTFPVAGPVVTIPALQGAAVAFRQQQECMDRLATLLEKVIAAS